MKPWQSIVDLHSLPIASHCIQRHSKGAVIKGRVVRIEAFRFVDPFERFLGLAAPRQNVSHCDHRVGVVRV